MKVLGITFGAFDLLHAGHVAFLRECRSQCDYLIVGLQVNPRVDRTDKHKPIQSIVERQFQLIECASVNNVWIYETEEDLENILKLLNPTVRFLGADYNDGQMKRITGEALVPIKIIPRNHTFSSSELRERIKRS